MSFLRPEVASFVRTWREPLVLALVLVLSLLMALAGTGPARFLGGLGAVAAGLALVPAWFLVRHRPRTGDPGVVEIVERELTYLGPVFGGSLSLDALRRAEIVVGERDLGDGARYWALHPRDGPGLSVPTGASGGEKLAEVLSALPGIDLASLHRALTTRVPGTYLVWKAGP
jgi:hypothetical protein